MKVRESFQNTQRAARKMTRKMLNRGSRFALGFQALLARIFLPLLFPVYHILLRFVLGYKIPGYRKIRRRIRHALGRSRQPLIICPNHLTMIDSIILIWSMTSWWRAFFDPRFFPWNTPEKTNFAHNGVVRFFAYMGKCIEIVRKAPKEQTNKLMAKLKTRLVRGQSLMIFPEGKRSREGRVDTENYAYGVGKIIDDLKQLGTTPRVLCIYLRGLKQRGHSTIPKRGDTFHLSYKLLEPQSEYQGLRAHRDLSTQIVSTLAEMEQDFFQQYPEILSDLPGQ